MSATCAAVAGRVLSGLAVALLALDAVMKLVLPRAMIDHGPPLGLPADVGFHRLLGAILVTGFRRGTVPVNRRTGMPVFANALFDV